MPQNYAQIHNRQVTHLLRQAFLVLVILMTMSLEATAASQDFPLYPVITKNVQFWEKIYAVYSLRQAVIHDSEDLSKIYEVVELVDPEMVGARKINLSTQKQACEKYNAMLVRLTQHPPSTAEEKRVAALFTGKDPKNDMAVAAANVRSQSGQKERFLAGVISSGAYLPEIKKILRSHGLPEELAFLPHVESSFNLKAYSRLGAAGIWQFTRETGKQYLTIDYTLDERLDPIRATLAAAKYLKNSYQNLNNWPLAVTSYNYGLGGIIRAVNEEGSYDKIFTNYKKGHFKFASRNFYSEFLAAINVATHLEKVHKSSLTAERPWQYLTLPGYVHVIDIANHFGVAIQTLSDWNPALLAPVMTGEKYIPKGYALRLPGGSQTNQLIASFSPSSFKIDQKSSLYHVVQKGDTARSIARLHGITLSSLIAANSLDAAATIRQKQQLRIPSKSNMAMNGPSKGTPSSRINIRKEITTKDALTKREV